MPDLDKIFKAYDVRGTYPDQLDESAARAVGVATAQFMRERWAAVPRIVVGRDMRPQGDSLAAALMGGILSTGATCIDLGLCDTPMVYFAVNHLDATGGIMVTASHNPIEYDGFKITGPEAAPIGGGSGLEAIEAIAKSVLDAPLANATGERQTVDLWQPYRQHVLKFLRVERPVKVVADASNGMFGKALPAVFDGVDGLEIVPLNFGIGGGFVHSLNPLEPGVLDSLCDRVRETGADLGVCSDGDADRCTFVDETGTPVRADIMIALMAQDFLTEHKGATVVYGLRCSRIVPEVVRAAGGVPRRERVGPPFMKGAMSETDAIFGGEFAAHFYFRNNFHADSGMIPLAHVASILSAGDKPLSGLVAPLQKYSHSGEVNLEVEDKEGKMQQVAQAFPDAETDHLDGITCAYPDWWCNVRPSNTEPLLRLCVEASTDALMQEKLARLKDILRQ